MRGQRELLFHVQPRLSVSLVCFVSCLFSLSVCLCLCLCVCVTLSVICIVPLCLSLCLRLSSLPSQVLSYNNGLAQLPASICELTQLRRLFVSHTAISALPQSISALGPLLLTLDISYNRLTSLTPAAIRDLVHLEELNIAGNQLSTLPSADIRRLTRLRKRDFDT